ncbi:MAG: metallophosphoesterase [Haloarculaceae archaeon]
MKRTWAAVGLLALLIAVVAVVALSGSPPGDVVLSGSSPGTDHVTDAGTATDRLTTAGAGQSDGTTYTATTPATQQPTSEPVTVAFIGDQGTSEHARAVLRMIDREDADLVVHSGDFDYYDSPGDWSAMIDEELGPDVAYLAVVGNHDRGNWSGYRPVIENQTERADNLTCSGDTGLLATCTYRTVTVVQSSMGMCNGQAASKYPGLCGELQSFDQEAYVSQSLSNASTTWRICSFHKVNHAYQVGDKPSDVPVSMYDTCRRGGAIVATGHDHDYARTYPMANYSRRTVASRSPPYTVGPDATFAVVSGVAGTSFYSPSEMARKDWWAKTYTNGSFGAFICTFRQNGTGECYFETADGEVVDGPFAIRSRYGPPT